MPDSAQDKTEAPTPRRREEARNRGQIGKSTDLAGAVVLLGGMIVLYVMGQKILERLLVVTKGCLGANPLSMTDPGQAVPTLAAAFQEVAAMCLPMMLTVLVLALVTAFAQVGVLFTFKPIIPSWSKLSPINGVKRMFNARAFVQLLMGIAKMALLTAVAYWTLKGRVDVLAQAATLSHLSIVAVAADILFTLGIRLAIVLLILGIIDFIWQRYKTEQELKMTKEEVKDELKRMEGDPKVKHKRREVQMQIAIQRIRSAVPKADVVITNPTELAIAIEYHAETMVAPKLTAKGAGYLAQKIRELAIEHGVPIVERKPLARALYREVEVGQEVPPHFYKALAEILAYVYELSGKGYGGRTPAAAALN